MTSISGKSLRDDQNDRVREIVRELITKEFAGNATAAARAFGVRQSLVSEFLSGARGADGLELWEATMPRRCGVHAGSRIYLPAGLCEADADLVIDHERTHAWIDRRGLVHATEADAWLATADAIWTPGAVRPQGFPDWFLDAAEMSREPWRDAAIRKVIGWH